MFCFHVLKTLINFLIFNIVYPKPHLILKKKSKSVSVTLHVLCICHIELHQYYITIIFFQCSSNKTQNSNFRKIHILLFQCPLVCLEFIFPIVNFTLIRRRHRNRWRGGELKMLTYTRVPWPVHTHCKQKLVVRYAQYC